MMSEKPGHMILVGVETAYLPEQSAPQAGRYAFAYTITIRNEGASAAKLLNRHWLITDGDNSMVL